MGHYGPNSKSGRVWHASVELAGSREHQRSIRVGGMSYNGTGDEDQQMYFQMSQVIWFFHAKYAYMAMGAQMTHGPASSRVSLVTTTLQCHMWLNGTNIPLVFSLPDFGISSWSPKWIQMKKVSTGKMQMSPITTTFVLVISLSDILWKKWISNVRNTNIIFHG
jgi:hypothetical protein